MNNQLVKIFIVEDDEFFSELIKAKLLQEEKYEISVFTQVAKLWSSYLNNQILWS